MNSKTAKQKRAIEKAQSYIGAPYRSCGYDQNGMDCSGLTQAAYPDYFGPIRPGGTGKRSAANQLAFLRKNGDDDLPFSQLQPGDLVYFRNDTDGSMHTAIVKQINDQKRVNIVTASSDRFKAVTDKEWLNSKGNLGTHLHYLAGGRPK